MSRRGAFIALEGIDGAGKSLQLQLLAETLRAQGHDVLTTREPGGTPMGDAVRSVVLDPELDIGPEAEFLLYSASRAQHVREVIRPALERGQIVLSDRFSGASLAYQGYGRGLQQAVLMSTTLFATRGLLPDLTVVIDLPVEIALARVGSRGVPDRLELSGEEFFGRARRGFLKLAANQGWLVVDGEGSVEEVRARVWEALERHLPAPVAAG